MQALQGAIKLFRVDATVGIIDDDSVSFLLHIDGMGVGHENKGQRPLLGRLVFVQKRHMVDIQALILVQVHGATDEEYVENKPL